MNDLARTELINAWANGVPQTTGEYQKLNHDGTIKGLCALGVLGFETSSELSDDELILKYELKDRCSIHCPECTWAFPSEARLIVHLNDDHEFDFVTIARKMP